MMTLFNSCSLAQTTICQIQPQITKPLFPPFSRNLLLALSWNSFKTDHLSYRHRFQDSDCYEGGCYTAYAEIPW